MFNNMHLCSKSLANWPVCSRTLRPVVTQSLDLARVPNASSAHAATLLQAIKGSAGTFDTPGHHTSAATPHDWRQASLAPTRCPTPLATWQSLPIGRHQSNTVRCQASQSSASNTTVFTLPTILTLGRVIAIPFLIAAWYRPAAWSSTAVTALFLAASITDWLDGYLARKLNASSAFGAFLDPVADKLMVATVLILLSTQPLAAGPLAGDNMLVPVCTLAIIGREITMSALREWAASLGSEARGAVAVSWMGKWKTATQMASLTLLLLIRDGPVAGLLGDVAGWAGPGLLVVATALTVLSLIDYLRSLWKYMIA